MLIKESDITVDGDRVQIVMSLVEGREELAIVAHMTADAAIAVGKAIANAGARVERMAPKRDRLRLVDAPAHDHFDGAA